MKNRLTTVKIGAILFLIAILSIVALADEKTDQVDKLHSRTHLPYSGCLEYLQKNHVERTHGRCLLAKKVR